MWFCFIWSQFSKKWKHNANFKKASVIAVPLVYHVLIKQVWYIHGFLHDDSSLPLVCGNCFLNRHKVAFWNLSSIFGVQNFESLSTCFTFDCVVDTWARPCMTFNHVSYFYIYIYIYISLFHYKEDPKENILRNDFAHPVQVPGEMPPGSFPGR